MIYVISEHWAYDGGEIIAAFNTLSQCVDFTSNNTLTCKPIQRLDAELHATHDSLVCQWSQQTEASEHHYMITRINTTC
jgi:hypothetical protein